MADYSCAYTLGAITFNGGTLGNGSLDDLYWISTIHGLDGPSIRTPIDDVPFGHGGIVHKFWKGPRHVQFEGSLVVQSTDQSGCQEVLNGMEKALRDMLDGILQTPGTLAWTPTGEAAQTLSVFYEISVDFQPTEDYRLRSFNFGLVSESPDPS